VGGLIVYSILVSLVTIAVLQALGMFVFSLLTPFNDLEELRKGNTAVGLAMGGKFLSTGIILGVSAYTNHSIWFMALWFAVGYVCLVATYFVFDWLTPGIKLSEQLQKGNAAVGTFLAFVYVGISFAVSSLII
jgi:putative membrane protein